MTALSEKVHKNPVASWLQETFHPRSPLARSVARALFTADDRVRIYRKLAVLVRNGQRLQDALKSLRDRAAQKSSTDSRAIVLSEIHREVDQGISFGKSLRRYAPLTETMIIQAGETSGNLPEALEMASGLILSGKKMRTAVLGAVAYPGLIMAAILVILMIFGRVVIPAFAAVYNPGLWTGTARVFYAVCSFVNSWWMVLIIFLLILTITGFFISMKRWATGARITLDKAPPYSFYRLLVGGSWLLSLAALLRAGVTLSDALHTMRKGATERGSENPWLHERLNRTIYYINHGRNLGEALSDAKTGFPDEEIIEDLMIYSTMGDFDATLYRIGTEWVDEGVAKVQTQGRILNLATMFMAAGVIAITAMGFYQVIQQMTTALSTLGGAGAM